MSLTRFLAFWIRPALGCSGILLFLVLSVHERRAYSEPIASSPDLHGPGVLPETQPGVGTEADNDGVSRDRVKDAIDRAQSYLQSRHEDNQRKNKQDNWEASAAPVAGDPGFLGARWGELTGLSLLAQMSGEGPGYDVGPAFEWFAKAKLDDPRAIALRLRLCEFRLPTSSRDSVQERLSFAKTNANLLRNLKKVIPDLAISSDAPPALLLAMRVGADVPDDYWHLTDAAWRKAQRTDGSWFDRDADPPAVRVATTAKGVTALLLARLALFSADTDCKDRPPDTHLNAAFAWLDQHAADAMADPEAMFALAGAGTTSGRKMFGSTNWYLRGAAELLKRQNADGSWPAAPQLTGADPAAKLIPETAYGALFLNSGLRWVGITKLDYELPPLADGRVVTDPGNRRPDDVARFADWADRELCGGVMTWERVDARISTREMSDAALLYISGHEPLAFNAGEDNTLRGFVRQGGLILGNAECGSAPFVESFTALGKRLFPDYAFRELPLDHTAFTDEMFNPKRWRNPPKVLGLSNGVRELMVISPDTDIGKAWQSLRPGSSGRQNEPLELSMDILLYQNGRNSWDTVRGQSRSVELNTHVKASRTIKVARLIHPANADPEPGGWKRLSILMHNDVHTDIETTAVQVGSGKLKQADFQVAHLTGTGKLSLTDADRNEIAAFVKDGGTLIVDAAGGSTDFAESAGRELLRIFPYAAARPDAPAAEIGVTLEKDADVFALHALESHSRFLRRYALSHALHNKQSYMQAINLGQRHAVFFSPLDLSNGVVGQETDGILGYAPETATAIMRNLLLYAAGER